MNEIFPPEYYGLNYDPAFDNEVDGLLEKFAGAKTQESKPKLLDFEKQERKKEKERIKSTPSEEIVDIQVPIRGEIQLEESIENDYYLKPEFVGSDASAYE